jgi:hypothetical protein
MGEDNDRPHLLSFPEEYKRDMERAAALLNKKDWAAAVGLGMRMVQFYSEAYVKGKTNYVFCTPNLDDCIENHPDFFEALCQEGVIEWLTPFVMGKSTTPPEESQ